MEHVLSPTTVSAQLRRLKTVPKDLYLAYSGVIERIKSEDQDDADFGMRIISWIHRSRRILKMDELLEALAVEEYLEDASNKELDVNLDAILEERSTPTDLVKICKGLVLYDELSGAVRFSHETVDGFVQNELEEKSKLPTSTILAKTCLIYLSSPAFDVPCHDVRSLIARLERYKFSGYASQYWADHIKCNRKGEEQMQNALYETFQLDGRREAMGQIAHYIKYQRAWFKSSIGRSFFHIIAANGLAKIFRHLLNDDNGRYFQKFCLC